jgi:GH25 family lysozyme M1 (1,4-beta-N-acetylmuramidase)
MSASRSCRRALTALTLVASVGAGAIAHPPPAQAAPRDTGRWPKGVDVASHQHPDGRAIDWRAVRAAGISFAFVKVDEGATGTGAGRYANPWFRADWDGARAAGVVVGPYHYARPRRPVNATAEADARTFVAAVGPSIRAAGIPPVLDLEEPGGLGAGDVSAWAHRWLTTIRALTGRTPIIYTGLWYWNSYVAGTAQLADNPLWIARYAESPGLLPGGWRTWSFWQFTPRGRVPGIPADVDLSLSCGRPTELVNECPAPTYAGWAAATYGAASGRR